MMPKLNPYEAPQEDSQPRRPRLDLKPPAFWLAVAVQAICLGAAVACMNSVGGTPRHRPVHGIRELMMIMLAFAALMGVGIMIVAQRYQLQGWVAGEMLLLIFMFLIMFAG